MESYPTKRKTINIKGKNLWEAAKIINREFYSDISLPSVSKKNLKIQSSFATTKEEQTNLSVHRRKTIIKIRAEIN